MTLAIDTSLIWSPVLDSFFAHFLENKKEKLHARVHFSQNMTFCDVGWDWNWMLTVITNNCTPKWNSASAPALQGESSKNNTSHSVLN